MRVGFHPKWMGKASKTYLKRHQVSKELVCLHQSCGHKQTLLLSTSIASQRGSVKLPSGKAPPAFPEHPTASGISQALDRRQGTGQALSVTAVLPGAAAQQPGIPGSCRVGIGVGRGAWGRQDLPEERISRLSRCRHSLLEPQASASLATPCLAPSLPPQTSAEDPSCSTYPSKRHSDRPQDGPPNIPRPSGHESWFPVQVWLRAGARRESRPLTPRARCGGSRKQLNFTTA